MSTSVPKRFRATLEPGGRALGWTIARLPFQPANAWTSMVRLRVAGTINSYSFRTSLFPDPEHPGSFFLLINRAMQEGASVALGGTADFILQPDFAPRDAELPESLATQLESEPGLRDWYDELTEYTRREIGKWLLAVKSPEAQQRRAEQVAERLLATMDAEQELPPAIVNAFRLRPKARAGWEKLNPAQRRGELMAVFYYQTREAREKRIMKLCDLAEARAARDARQAT